MEKQYRHYSIEGLEFDVPLRKLKGHTNFSECHDALISHTKYTPLGHPVILSWDWVCKFFDKLPSCLEDNIRRCECSDCKYFVRAEADQPTLIGICTKEEKKKDFDPEKKKI